MNPFRMRSKRMEEPPGGDEGGGEYGSPGDVPGVPFDPTNPYAPGNAENPFPDFGPWNGPSANTNGGPDVIQFPEAPPNVAVKSTPDVGNPGVDINNPTWGPYTIAEPAAGRVKGWPDLPGANDEPGALPPDDAIAMPPEPMPWDANLGQKFPEGWDPLAKYLHDETAPSALPRFPEATGALGGVLPLLYAALGPLGVDPELTWELDQARRMARGTAGAETPTDLAPDTNSQQLGTADSGTDIFDPLSGQNTGMQDAGMQELMADEDQRGNSGPPTEGPPYDSSDVTGVYDPDSGGVIDTTGGGSSDTPPSNQDAGVPYTDPTQPPGDQNQYFTDPFSYEGGGGYTGGYDAGQGAGSPNPVYSGPPDQGYNVGFIPGSGVNTGVNGEGGGSGGGYDTGGFGGGGSVGGGDMGDGSDTIADWLDWLFGGGGGSPHTGTSDPFRVESIT